jgi:hypothetical protein
MRCPIQIVLSGSPQSTVSKVCVCALILRDTLPMHAGSLAPNDFDFCGAHHEYGAPLGSERARSSVTDAVNVRPATIERHLFLGGACHEFGYR